MLRRSTVTMAGTAATLRDLLKRKDLFLDKAALVNGKPTTAISGEFLDVTSPATDKVMGQIPNMGYDDTVKAIESANAAFAGWASTPPAKRSQVLRDWGRLMKEHQDDMAAILSVESGKAYSQAVGEHVYSTGYVDWYAGEAERIYGDIIDLSRPGVRALVRQQPIGVVAVVTPWNFPSAMITRAAAGALAAGCTVVVKPADMTPYTAFALGILAAEAGVPAGAFNVVVGAASEIGKAMTDSTIVRKISFTGSTGVGKHLYEQSAKTVKKLGLELGGNAPVIVCGDAEMDIAIEGTMQCKFRNAGQVCIAGNRFFVAASIHDEYVSRLLKRIDKDLKPGNAGPPGLAGVDKNATLGSLISAAHAKKVKEAVDAAVKEGAKVECGGDYIAGLPKTFFAPTVLTNVKSGQAITDCEVFGPVLSVIKYDDDKLDDVIKQANDVPAGLAAYVFTSDYRKQWQLSEQLQCGMVGVNEGAISSPLAPFGGMKESGLGRDGSKYGISEFLQKKYVLMGGKI